MKIIDFLQKKIGLELCLCLVCLLLCIGMGKTEKPAVVFAGEDDRLYAASTENIVSALDINTADAAALKTLPGIGEKLAARIVAYREMHGAFHKTEDIMRVRGIGEALYNKLKNQITV